MQWIPTREDVNLFMEREHFLAVERKDPWTVLAKELSQNTFPNSPVEHVYNTVIRQR